MLAKLGNACPSASHQLVWVSFTAPPYPLRRDPRQREASIAMHNRIGGPSTRPSQTHEASEPVDSDSFRQILAGVSSRSMTDPHANSSPGPTRPRSIVSEPPIIEFERLPFGTNRQNRRPRTRLPPGELPDKMGCCVSTPQATDPHNPSTSSPARPSNSVFQYRTAELHQANVDGICVGLAAEWLGILSHSPSTRMDALAPGSRMHDSAAVRQERYIDFKRELRGRGAGASQADIEAQNRVFREANLDPSGKEKVYEFGERSSLLRMVRKITDGGSKYLLSLYFADGGSHVVATATLDGRTTLFDPNYGEFTAQPDEMEGLLESLANRYRNPNGRQLTTITTQKIN
ncbi:YopT-type cysteine protease domain-containing protein [Bradyrhizobium sp. BR 1433]|uniref:YopT-type cysteine protease domain-containing protein n=1 Tax=Bradyrhizobium sp. BR 1433 TaxID=3447967 RepID=UPI003EE6AD6C